MAYASSLMPEVVAGQHDSIDFGRVGCAVRDAPVTTLTSLSMGACLVWGSRGRYSHGRSGRGTILGTEAAPRHRRELFAVMTERGFTDALALGISRPQPPYAALAGGAGGRGPHFASYPA